MTDAAQPRRFGLSELRLSWKVIVVLVVPLIVAMVLGGLRISSQISESRKLGAAAEQVRNIPLTIELEGIAGTVAASQASGTVTDADLDELAKRIDDVANQLESGGVDADTAAAMQVVLDKSKQIQAGGKTIPSSLQGVSDTMHEIQAQSVRAVESAAADVADPAVVKNKTTLVDALSVQQALFDTSIAAVRILRDPKDPGTELQAALGGEHALLEKLARNFPTDDRTVADLRKGNDNRLQMLAQLQSGQPFPLLEARDSMIDSLDTLKSVESKAARAITGDVQASADSARDGATRDTVIVLLTLLAALALAIVVARSMIKPLRRLRDAARKLAEVDLPAEVERIKVGESVENVAQQPVPVHTREEIGQVARAVDDIHGQALHLAGEQATLRLQVNDMFETLARRSKSLVDHQLGLIEAMEFEEKDPKLLEGLFRLDHLAARMRRNGDNLLILAGTRVRRAKTAPVEIGDVLRAAISEVEEYQRVKLNATPRGLLVEPAATDIAHLVAELLDNALRASPPETDVRFTFAQANDQGLLVEVADRGIGIPPPEMDRINEKLQSAAEVGPDTARQMGLFVVSRLADRHGLDVRMRPTFDTARDPGVTVTVHIPRRLIIPPGGAVKPSALSAPPKAPAAVAKTQGGNLVVTMDTNGQSGALPQRRPGGSVLPQRQPGNGAVLPQRTPGATPTALPQRQPGNGLPQRQPGGAELPQRKPNTDLPHRQPVQPIGLSGAVPATPPDTPAPPADGPGVGDRGRHSYKTNPTKTASFFQTRLKPPIDTDNQHETPIFADMVSAWLTDPTSQTWGLPRAFDSAADEGWKAAQRATETPAEDRTTTGLPIRHPGERLVPGTVNAATRIAANTRRRDPDAIRASLARHQQGVRDGRAVGTTNATDDRGDR